MDFGYILGCFWGSPGGLGGIFEVSGMHSGSSLTRCCVVFSYVSYRIIPGEFLGTLPKVLLKCICIV